MIEIIMNLKPFSDPTKKVHLGTVHVFNLGTGTKTSGNYGYRLFDKAGRPYKEGTVEKFPRVRLIMFDLLYRVLRHAFGDRNA
jgi:hypothetical protein